MWFPLLSDTSCFISDKDDETEIPFPRFVFSPGFIIQMAFPQVLKYFSKSENSLFDKAVM